MRAVHNVKAGSRVNASWLALVALLSSILSHAAWSDIVPPKLDYQETTVDLRVKVMGGFVELKRTRKDYQWMLNEHWGPLTLSLDSVDGSVKSVVRGEAEYLKKSPGIFVLDAHNVITATDSGYRWRDRKGNWIDYDANGKMLSYGNRNDVKVTLGYDANGRISGVFDHFGTQVIWYEYTGEYLTAVRDYTNRRVQYRSGAVPNASINTIELLEVIDVRGNSWIYTYGGPSAALYDSSFSSRAHRASIVSRLDPEGRTKRIVRTGVEVSEKDDDNIGASYFATYDEASKTTYTRVTSAGGKVTETWTDGNGKLKRKDVNGRTVQTRDLATSTDRMDVTVDERGNKTTTVQDEWGNTIKTVYPDGATVSYQYEPTYNHVTQKIDERGIVTKYEYDARGNLIRLIEAVGKPEQRITEYSYDVYGNKISEKRVADAVTAETITTFTYDNRGNITTAMDAENHKTTYTYDVTGNVLTLTDARNKAWTVAYDNAGSPITYTNPLAHVTKIEYDKVGNRNKVVNALNDVTQYVYDRRNNLIRTIDAMGGVWQVEYNGDNQVVKQVDPEGKAHTFDYDSDGRLVKTVDGNGNEIKNIYGEEQSALKGLRTEILHPTFTRRFNYDGRNRIVRTTDVLDTTTQYINVMTYDAGGNKTSAVDAANNTTFHEYDALNRPIRTRDSNGGDIIYTYDNRDNLIAITDPKGNIRRFQYDRTNKKIKETRPGGQEVEYEYDPTGNLTQITDAKGQIRKFAFDDIGQRATDTHYLSAAAQTAFKTVAYRYNEIGILTGYSDGYTSADYTVDALGRKTREVVSYGPFALTYSYTYYANGKKKTFTGADNSPYIYTYDGNDQIKGIQLPIGMISYNDYRWLAPTVVTLPGGTTKQFSYDPLLRLKSVIVNDPGQSEVMNHQYSYDNMGNLVNKSTEDGSHSYGYDRLYRLTHATTPKLSSEVYAYDSVHNRIIDNKSEGAWTYDANNQLERSGDTSYSYDPNGNTTRKSQPAAITEFSYNNEDRLTEVKDDQGYIIATYYYDPFGRRLWKEVNGARTYFFYADEGLVSEHDEVGAVTAVYGYVPDGMWTTAPQFLRVGGQYYFYHNDRNGEPAKLTDTRGTVAWEAIYTAFGIGVTDSASIIVNNLRASGQYYDSETGLHYNWHRYYVPESGRYLTSDPIGLGGGINAYAYVQSNPGRWIDPTGLCWGPLTAINHAYFGGGRDVTLHEIGCYDEVTANISPQLNGWKNLVYRKAERQATTLPCNSARSFIMSQKVGAQSGIFWIRGLRLNQQATCSVSKNCCDNNRSCCLYNGSWSFSCSLKSVMHDQWQYPSDWDNDGQEFYDKWEYGMTRFYVDGLWTDTVSGGGTF